MRKRMFASALLAFFLMASLSAMAQSEKKMPAQEAQMKVVEELTKTMTKQYGLSSEQSAALKQLNLKRMKDLAAIDAAMDIKKANAAQRPR